MKKLINNPKGSITLFTLIAMMFFLTIAFTAYASAMIKLQSQNDDLERIKASYEQDLTEEGLASLYEKLTTYTVTFNANGGYVEQKNKKVKYGEEYGELPIPTRNGYKFMGWNGENLLNLTSNDSVSSFGVTVSNNKAKFCLNGFTQYWVAGEKAFDLYNINNIANYPVYLNIRNSQLLAKGTYTFSIYKISGNTPNQLCRIGIITCDSSPSNRKYISTIKLSNDERYNTFTLLNDTEVYFYLSFMTNESSNSGNVEFNNIQFYVQLQKNEHYEPYYITNSTKVTQKNNHTLTAIWEEN